MKFVLIFSGMALQKQRYKVIGMSCASCATSVESMLKSLSGVNHVQVHFSSSLVEVGYDSEKISFSQMRQAIRSLGYDLFETEKASAQAQQKYLRALRLKVWFLGGVGLPLAGVLMVWGHHVYVALVGTLIGVPMVLWGGHDFLRAAWAQLKIRQLSMDTLIALAILAALAHVGYSLLRGGMPAIETALEILFFVVLGRYWEEKARLQTETYLYQLKELFPAKARKANQPDILIPVETLSVGDIVEVHPQEKIPLDGKVIRGSSYVDESWVTGESMPVLRETSMQVWAGTQNLSDTLWIQVEKIQENTLLGQILERLQVAQEEKAHLQRIADVIASYFVPTVLFLASGAALYWGLHASAQQAWERFLSVLVISCPCALGLATPIALKIAIGVATKFGIVAKEVKALELLSRADVWAFDKTGTLTQGHPTVSHWTYHASADFLPVLYTALRLSQHPLARALARFLQEKYSIREPLSLVSIVELAGKGFVFSHEEKKYYVGNLDWLRGKGITVHEIPQTAVGIATDEELLGWATFEDEMHISLKQEFEALRRQGKSLVLLSGDHNEVVQKVASALGISEAYGKLTPLEKADWIQKRRQEGKKVVFVGDGINDALALREADIGIAMGSGAGAALQAAPLVLLHPLPQTLPVLVRLTQALRKRIYENLFWAFGYNFVAIPAAMGILPYVVLSPGMSALSMAISSIVVVLNSLRIKKLAQKSFK
ncbi:MAG: heavy metal translocating P-type ATPase [Bacteroidia bacterium]